MPWPSKKVIIGFMSRVDRLHAQKTKTHPTPRSHNKYTYENILIKYLFLLVQLINSGL